MSIPPGDDPEFRDVAKAKSAPRRRFLLSEALLAIAVLGVLIGLFCRHPALREKRRNARSARTI